MIVAMIRKKRNPIVDDDNDEVEEETLEERAERLACSSEWAWENQPRHRNLSAKFRIGSDNLEKRMTSDLKTLSEIETATATMRQYVINGEIYAGSNHNAVTVSDCMKIKRSAREKTRSVSSLSSTLNDFNQTRDSNNQTTALEFVGENVFLTAEPYDERKKVEVPQTLPVLTRIYSTPPHASKLEVMRKHNVSRLRQQNLKTEINEMQKTSTMKNIEGDKIIKKNTIEDYSIVEAELSCHVPCAIDNIVLQKSESTNLVVSNMIRKSDGICDDKDDVTFSNNRNTNIVINLDKNTKDQNIDDNKAKEQHKIIKNDANDNRSDIHDDNDDNSCNNSNDNINRKNSNGTIGNTDHEDNSDSINHYSSTKNYDGNNLCDNIMKPISSIAKMNHADKPINKSTSPSTYKKNSPVKDIQYSDNFNSTLNFSKNLENGVENCLEIDKNSHNFDDREISCESLSFDKFDPVNSEIIVKNDVNNNNTETCKVNIIKSEFEICKYADDDCIIKQERIEFEKEFHSNDIDQNFNFKMHEISRQQQMILMTVKKEYELEFEKDELQRILKHKLLRDEMDLNMLRYTRSVPDVTKTKESWSRAKKSYAREAQKQHAIALLRDEKIIFEKELKISQAKDDLSKILELKLTVSKKSKGRKRRSNRDISDIVTDGEGLIKKDGDRILSRSRSAGHTCTNNINTTTYNGVINIPVIRANDNKKGEDEEKNMVEDNEKNIPCNDIEIESKNVRDDQHLLPDDILQEISVSRKSVKKGRLQTKTKEKMIREMKKDKSTETGEGKRMNNNLSIQSAIDQRFDLGSGKEWLEAVFAERRMNSEKAIDLNKAKEIHADKKNNELEQNCSLTSKCEIEFNLTKNKENQNTLRKDYNSLSKLISVKKKETQSKFSNLHEIEEFEERKSSKKSKKKRKKSKKIKKIIVNENDVEISSSGRDEVNAHHKLEIEYENKNKNVTEFEKTDLHSMLPSLPNIRSENSLHIGNNSSSSSGRNSGSHTPLKNSNTINNISYNSIYNADDSYNNNNSINSNNMILKLSNNDKNKINQINNNNIDNNNSYNYDLNYSPIQNNNNKLSVNIQCDIFNQNAQSEITLAEVLADIERTKEFSKRSARGLESNLQFDLLSNLNQSSSPQSNSSLKTLDLLPVSFGTFFDPSSSTDEKGRFKVQDPREFEADSVRCLTDCVSTAVTLVIGRKRKKNNYLSISTLKDVNPESDEIAEELIAVLFDRCTFAEEKNAKSWWLEHRRRLLET